MKKSEAMQYVIHGRMLECFTHVDEDGTRRQYNVSALRKMASEGKYEVFEAQVTDVLNHLLETRQFDADRVLEISREAYLNDPAIVLRFDEPGGPLLIADGVHRIIRRSIEGMDTFLCYVVPEKEAPRVPAGYADSAILGVTWGKPI